MPPKPTNTDKSVNDAHLSLCNPCQYFALCAWNAATNDGMLPKEMQPIFGLARFPQDIPVWQCWIALFKLFRISVEEVTAALQQRELKTFFCQQVCRHAAGIPYLSPPLAPCVTLLRARGATREKLEASLEFDTKLIPLTNIEAPIVPLAQAYGNAKVAVLGKAIKLRDVGNASFASDMIESAALPAYEKALTLIEGVNYPLLVPQIAVELISVLLVNCAACEMRLKLYEDAEDSAQMSLKFDPSNERAQKALEELERLKKEREESKKKQQEQTRDVIVPHAVIVTPGEDGLPGSFTEVADLELSPFRRPVKPQVLITATGGQQQYRIVKVPVAAGSRPASAHFPNAFGTRVMIDETTGVAPLRWGALDCAIGPVAIFKQQNEKSDDKSNSKITADEARMMFQFVDHLLQQFAQKKQPNNKEELRALFEAWSSSKK